MPKYNVRGGGVTFGSKVLQEGYIWIECIIQTIFDSTGVCLMSDFVLFIWYVQHRYSLVIYFSNHLSIDGTSVLYGVLCTIQRQFME